MATEKPTSAASWRNRAKPELVTLPSTLKARLRKSVNTWAAMRAGVLTAEHVRDFQATQRGELRDAARAMALQDALIAWLFVAPRCVLGEDKVPAGAIHIDDLDEEDLDFLVDRAFGGASDDASFPDAAGGSGDGAGAGAGADSEGLADDAEPAGGDGGGDAGGVPDRPPARRSPQRAAGSGKKRS